jgi:hypothetical protein
VGRRPIWEVHADPLGLTRTDPTLDAIRAGRWREMRGKLQRALLEDPDNARIRLLLAFTWVPGLLDPFPDELDRRHFADADDGWNDQSEFEALAHLAYARRAPGGKEGCPRMFDAATHVLAARIYARRFLDKARPKSVAWVDPWNRCMSQIKDAIRNDLRNDDALKLLEAMKARIPAGTMGRPK